MKISNIQPVSRSEAESLRFEIVFQSRECGKIKGFRLCGIGKTESEQYALSFVKAMQIGKGEIGHEDSEIIFTHRGISEDKAERSLGIFGISDGGVYSTPLEEKYWIEIEKMLSGEYNGEKCSVRYEQGFSRGFYFGAI